MNIWDIIETQTYPFFKGDLNIPRCGNGNLDEGEECDDGCMQGVPNVCEEIDNGDGCSSICRIERQCFSGADANMDGVITREELDNFILGYYLGTWNIAQVSEAIAKHLNGC